MDAWLSGVAPAGNALGVPFMDVEHEYIFGMYDELVRIVKLRASTKLFAERFACLTPYVASHFGHEEFIMRKLGYTKYFDHKAQHEKMLHDAEDFLWGIRQYYQSDQRDALAHLLSLWLKHHVEEHDRLLADFIKWQAQDVPTLQQLPILPDCGLAAASSPGSDARDSTQIGLSKRKRHGRVRRLCRYLLAPSSLPLADIEVR
jgi:hemerythrin-like metal-binding protein